MATTVAIDLMINTAQGAQSMSELKRAIKDLTNEAQKHEAGSAEFIKLQTAAAKAKDKIGDIREELTALNPENQGRVFASLTNNLVGGFQAAAGAATLFGASSQEVQKNIERLMAIQAIASGVQSAADLKRNLELTKYIVQQKIVTAQEWLRTTSINASSVATGIATAATRAWSAAMNALPFVAIGTAIALVVSKIYDYVTAQNEAKKADEEARKEKEKLYKEEYERATKAINDSIKLQEELVKKRRDLAANERESEINKINDYYNELLDKERSFNQQSMGEAERRTHNAKTIEELRRIELQKINDKYDAEALEKASKLDEKRLERNKIANEAYNQQVANYHTIQNSNEQANETFRTQLLDFSAEDRQKKQEQWINNSIALEEARFNLILEISQNTLSGLSSLNEIFVKNEKQKNEFDKKIALAQLAIDTAQSIGAIVKNVNTKTADPTGLSQVALISLQTAAVLSNIAKAKRLIEGANIGSSPNFSSGAGVGSTYKAPNLQSPIQQQQTQSTFTPQQLQPIQVYVLESDISKTQTKINNIQTRAKVI